MNRVKTIAIAAVLAVFGLWASGAAQDSNASERTFLTFSGAVEMPGLTLPAGTYVFKLADTASRNVVQVWDRDEKQMLGHWLFVQAERPEATGENVVMFKEEREGATPAIQYWYYPGERIGKEFVYPRDQGKAIAARTGTDVLTTEGEVGDNSRVSSVDAQGNVSEWQREERSDAAVAGASENAIQGRVETEPLNDAPAAAQPSASAGSLAGNRGVDTEPAVSADAEVSVQSETRTPPAQSEPRAVGTSGVQAESQTARADTLPATASPLALTGLIGLLSLAGAFGVRMLRQ